MVDPLRVQNWLCREVDVSLDCLKFERLPGGHSSGVYRIDFQSSSGPRSFVLRAASENPMVYQCDVGREGRILRSAYRAGAPVPEIFAIDQTGEILGVPSFVMELVEGRAFPDSTQASYHGPGWFRESDNGSQRAAWFSFIDLLAQLHSIAPGRVSATGKELCGNLAVIQYWRRSLLDVLAKKNVGRTLKIMDWLEENLPVDADESPALCMGDARAGNCLVSGVRSIALIDFEVCHIGNPASDIAYSLIADQVCRSLSDCPARGVPSAEETWDYWQAATGRNVTNRNYWTAFSLMILNVTVFRKLLFDGAPVQGIEDAHPFISMWHSFLKADD